MAKLEGSYEQIDKRLSSIETRLDSGFGELRGEISALRREQDAKFDKLDIKINRRFSLVVIVGGLLVIFQFFDGILPLLRPGS